MYKTFSKLLLNLKKPKMNYLGIDLSESATQLTQSYNQGSSLDGLMLFRFP